jgi:pimeloyl-ACP methyl ester carboxylesterase
MPNATLGDVELYYQTRGTGAPLLLIPGFASGAWSWGWQTDELARDFQVIVFDPRGISASAITGDSPVTIEAIADDSAKLLDALGIGETNVLGISFGGFVAQQFALQHPHRLKKLVLGCTSFGGPNHVLPSMDVLAAFSSTRGLNSPERIRQYMKAGFAAGFVDENPGEVERFCSLREQNPVPESVYLQQLGSATIFNSESAVGNISAETLVVSGDSDTVVPVGNSINLAASIPNSRLEIIPGAGHIVFVEQAEKFNSIVREFLR